MSDRRIKGLFGKILISMFVFAAVSVLFIILAPENESVYILLCAFFMGISILAFCWSYFKGQNEIMEHAVKQITDYISGNEDARIPCDEEGEMYRLFHEVNSLGAILKANAENERRSKQALKNAVSDISHQLKTPLAALNIYNGLLLGETKDLPQLNEFAALSEKELERIETLVQNLLKLTKLDAGTVVFEKSRENVAELMEETELHFSYRAKQEGKELTLEGGEDVFLFCDRNWLLEAVENIVKNAFDHTKEGDSVKIQWKQSASMVQITIRDTGSGIHPEDLHHIFKRFYRSRFSKDQQGIGLGLPLAKMIVEAHGGAIEVDSRPGEGTVFLLNFLIPTKL